MREKESNRKGLSAMSSFSNHFRVIPFHVARNRKVKIEKINDQNPVRIEFDHRIPCFHCSRPLQYVVSIKKYVGFEITCPDGIKRVFHSCCIKEYLA